MAYTFAKRTGPIKYSQVKTLKYYTQTNPFEVNSASGGNCTWWAWGRFWEVWASIETKYKTKRPTLVSNHNACFFYTDAKANGYKVGLIPKPGAIICWGYNGKPHGEPGHVAFVEKVNDDGSIEISHSGWSSGPMKNETLKRGDGKAGTSAYHRGYSNDYFNGFIYNPIDFGNPAGALGDDLGKTKDWYISKYGTGAIVYFELMKYGYSHKACCAVLGNMQQESGIRVKTGGSFDGYGSEGLCQWTFGRKEKMMVYAAQHSASGSWESADGQVAYLVYELENSEKSANAVLKNESLTLAQMTEEFEKKFERAGIPMMEKRVKYANEWNIKMEGAEYAADGNGQAAYADMRQRISKLYRSENYEYVGTQTKEQSAADKSKEENTKRLKDALSKVSFSSENNNASFFESVVNTGVEKTEKEKLVRTKGKFSLSEALIQAPFIEMDIAGYVIGSYRGNLDDYPNYISSLDVKKINGEINQYTISLIYQIRPGEDPNLLDRLFSKVRYNKISIRYGDCESGALFKDSEAIITNITQNRDYASSRITYTVYATSACNYVTSIKFDFPATVDRPSNIIRNLLYDNTQTSNLLLEAFPGMRNKTQVESTNLIPNNDCVLNIEAKKNINTLSYINYLVGCMSNITNDKNAIIRNSSYYITYVDDTKGTYFKINEITPTTSTSVLTNNLFEITVGYPDGNDVYDFKINNNEAWAILYNQESVSDEYIYGINNNGNRTLLYSPNLVGSSNILNEIQKNWWTQMTTYPITAQLTMRGLLKPISLMDYIQIDVVFYGQKHIASGLYAITGEQDILSGSGFMTNLSLIRVGD